MLKKGVINLLIITSIVLASFGILAQIDWIRAKLDKSERSGFTDNTKEQILNQSKSLLNG